MKTFQPAQFLVSRPPSCLCLRKLRPRAPLQVIQIICPTRFNSTVTFAKPIGSRLVQPAASDNPLPSPPRSRAKQSAKLAALHSRLSLPVKIPPEALARALIDPTADPHVSFNNANLSYLGSTIINYHTSEMLLCKYPRLPMAILYEAMNSYAGNMSLSRVARGWGVDLIHHPGEEVDPGFLQFSPEVEPPCVATRWGYKKDEKVERKHWRKGISSGVVAGDPLAMNQTESKPDVSLSHLTPTDVAAAEKSSVLEAEGRAYADFARAVSGLMLLYGGRIKAKDFVRAHVLSRRVNMSSLFSFKMPTRELSLLCRREEYEPPIARLISETGRNSRTPVFVVGIFSGKDKLGEGSGPSLNFARLKASMQALRSWYLYSPLDWERVPSDTCDEEFADKWKPVHIDMGEII